MRNFALLLLLLNTAYFAVSWNANKRAKLTRVVSSVEFSSAPVSLRLLSEEMATRLIGGAQDELPEVAVVQELEEIGGVEYCFSIGEFSDLVYRENTLADLLDLGYSAELLSKNASVVTGYWVHIPSFNSSVAANQKMQELEDKGIDSYVIPDGDLAQGISLGFFSLHESALTHQINLAGKGVPSTIHEVTSERIGNWIAINRLSESDFARFQRFDLLNSQSELKLEEKLCETIAPEL